jgi:adenylate cyclase
VNQYLGLVADIVIKQDGTLDKYIGDCVMAFWGAPTNNSKHASACVRAAIEAQRALEDFNRRRAVENKERELENLARKSAGLPPREMLPILTLGSGINSGMAIVGMMGSQQEQQNYTVFGREVNLASRLESLSGRGRIYISQATHDQLQREDPSLAATCISRPSEKVKGFSQPVAIYEVPWKSPEPAERPAAEPALPDASTAAAAV